MKSGKKVYKHYKIKNKTSNYHFLQDLLSIHFLQCENIVPVVLKNVLHKIKEL